VWPGIWCALRRPLAADGKTIPRRAADVACGSSRSLREIWGGWRFYGDGERERALNLTVSVNDKGNRRVEGRGVESRLVLRSLVNDQQGRSGGSDPVGRWEDEIIPR